MSLNGTTWKFNTTISGDKTFSIFDPVNYIAILTCDGTNCNDISFSHKSSNLTYDNSGGGIFAHINGAWLDESYRTITFIVDIDDSYCDGITEQEFVNWLAANAVQVDNSQRYITTENELTSIADAIRAKTGSEAPIVFPTGFVSEISKTPQIKVEYVEGTSQTIKVYLPTGTYSKNQFYTFNIFANSLTNGLWVENLAITYVGNTLSTGDIKNKNGETLSTCQFGVYKDSGELEIGFFSTAFTINEPDTIYAVLPSITYKGYAASL